MSCEHFYMRDENGNVTTGILCTRGRKPKYCRVGFCNKPSVALCDYPIIDDHGKAKTCDAPMCEQHRHPVPGLIDHDWCHAHWSFEQKRMMKPLEGELPFTFEK